MPPRVDSVAPKALKGIFWSTSEIWSGQVIQFLVFLTLARLLNPRSFGLTALAAVFINLLRFLTMQGLPDALVQKQNLNEETVSTVFWLTFGMSVLFAALLVAFSKPISILFHQPDFATVLCAISPILVLYALDSIQEVQFRRNLRFRPLAVRRTCANFIGGCCGIGLAFAGAGVYALIGSQIVTALIGVFLLWLQSSWRPSFTFSRESLREVLPFSLQAFGSSLLILVNKRADDLIIGSILGPVALGFYTVAYRILMVLNTTVTTVISRVAFPVFSRLQSEPERMLGAFRRTTHAASLLGAPMFGALACLAPIIIPVIFGPQWRQSVPVMQLLALVGLFQNILFFNNVVARAVGKPGYNTFFLGLNAAANLIGFLIFARQGILAFAVVLLVNTAVLSPISFIILRRLTGIGLLNYVRQFRGPAVSVVFAVLITHAVGTYWHASHETLLFLMLSGILFVSVYCGTLLVLDKKFICELLSFGISAVPAGGKIKKVFAHFRSVSEMP